MASISHGLPMSAGLEEAIKRIIKQHQRDCENAGEFGKAREARAALQELQHQSELEGLCRLFSRHYTQLSGAQIAYEKHLRMLDVNWQTQQLPELLKKVRRWRQQLQDRHEEELATLAPSKTEEDGTVLRPRFKKEAFDVQKKVLFLGHQGRYDEAEELQKILAERQRMDAAEHKADLQARRERQAQRLLTAQKAERQSLESRVERLVTYHNRQNAEAIDVLRRKYLCQRKSLVHNQALETQKYLHALRSFTPNDAVRMASSVVTSQWKVQERAVQGSDASDGESRSPQSSDGHLLLRGEGREPERELHTSISTMGKERQGQKTGPLSSSANSHQAKAFAASRSTVTVKVDQCLRDQTRKRQPKSFPKSCGDPRARSDTLSARLRGASTCLSHRVMPLRKSLTAASPRYIHRMQNIQNWKRGTLQHRHATDDDDGSLHQEKPASCRQDARRRRGRSQVQGTIESSQSKNLIGKSGCRTHSTEKGKPAGADALRDEILEAWKDCAAKVTIEQATAETLR